MERAEHGDLQRAILSIIWRRGSCTVREIHDELSSDRTIAYTTVLTVMTRLSERGTLKREKRGNMGVFSPATSKDPQAAGQLVDQLIGRFGTVGVSEFVERTRAEPELFDALTKLMKEGKRGKRR